jgi:hypothetical protein
MRVHDLRGTFVTISLSSGRSEAWIGDRTGHRSSQMIARYKRTARTFEELHTGELAPLDEALPELSIPRHCPMDSRSSRKIERPYQDEFRTALIALAEAA